MDVINQYKIESKSVLEYVPTANIEEIYIVNGLKHFLECTTGRQAYDAIRNTNNTYFQKAIGFQMATLSFDEQKLKQLVKNISLASSKQKQMSASELLTQMDAYQKLVMSQEAEKSNLSYQNHVLMSMTESVLQQGLNSAKLIGASKTKDKFRTAIDLMRSDDAFKRMDMQTQITALHNFLVADESLESTLKRKIAYQKTEY